MQFDNIYLIAIGSNQRRAPIGGPVQIIEQAIIALEMADISVFRQSHIVRSRPIGPSQRIYANSAAILVSPLSPPEFLIQLQQVEIHFGRKRLGQKWGARTLDLDIILWSGGIWASDAPALSIPHRDMKIRNFVLGPAAEIAAEWRDPISGRTIRQLLHQIMHPKPLDRIAKRD